MHQTWKRVGEGIFAIRKRHMKNTSDLIGRILIGLFFFYEAFDTMVFYNQTQETLTNYGITWAQDFLIVGSIIL